MLKIGLDFHGVIDKCPKTFAELSSLLVDNGHEVHILTGSQVKPKLFDKLNSFGIKYTHIFSITDYHKEVGTKVNFSDEDNPWIDEELWNRTKAFYCESNSIDLMLDDSPIYGLFFKTPYAHFNCKA